MDAMEAARQLGAAIQESPEYKEYQQFKAEVEADSGIKALVDEYTRLQSELTAYRKISRQTISFECIFKQKFDLRSHEHVRQIKLPYFLPPRRTFFW